MTGGHEQMRCVTTTTAYLNEWLQPEEYSRTPLLLRQPAASVSVVIIAEKARPGCDGLSKRDVG
jgi:hypothetical protein